MHMKLTVQTLMLNDEINVLANYIRITLKYYYY